MHIQKKKLLMVTKNIIFHCRINKNALQKKIKFYAAIQPFFINLYFNTFSNFLAARESFIKFVVIVKMFHYHFVPIYVM